MHITVAESVVMDVLWRQHPATAEAVIEQVAGEGWSDATVKTLLGRLLTRGMIAADRDGRRYLYRPLVERAAYERQESQRLVDRLFDGRLAPLVSHFTRGRKLTDTDVAELRKLIAELDDGN